MKTIRGRFDGKVVVLEEPAPVNHAVAVTVALPDEAQPTEQEATKPKSRFGWERTRQIQDGYDGSVADEVIRQRRMD